MSVIEIPKKKTYSEHKKKYFESMHSKLDSILAVDHLVLYDNAKEGLGVSTNISMADTFMLLERYKHAVLSQSDYDEDEVI